MPQLCSNGLTDATEPSMHSNERHDVVVQFLPRSFLDVHHVACGVVRHGHAVFCSGSSCIVRAAALPTCRSSPPFTSGCAPFALSAALQRALAARSFPHDSGPRSAADRRSISAAALTHFFRGTLAAICETSRAFVAVSVQVFASENRDLASQLASYNFLKQPAENTKATEVAADECFNLARPTGLEPATSGVTGRGSNNGTTNSIADLEHDLRERAGIAIHRWIV
jgi:hypothetical protein